MNRSMSRAIMGRIQTNSTRNLDVWMYGIGFLIPALYLFLHQQFSLLSACVSFGMLLILWLRDRKTAFAATFVFLFALGDIRRIIDMAQGTRGLDPMLLVGAVFAIYLAVPLLLRVKLTDAMSKAVLALLVIMVLEIFNPRQGSLLVGFSGAVFYIVPVLWFWIGRQFATDRILSTLFYRVVIPMGVLAALLGFYQTYIGFLPWEDAWIQSVKNDFMALNLGGGHIRAFGFSGNSVEFGNLLLLASTFVLAAIYSGRRAYALLLPVLLAAILLASMRAVILKLLFASTMMWAVRAGGGRAWIQRFVIGLVVGVGLLGYSVSRATGGGEQTLTDRSSSAQFATAHVTEGFAHPLDSKYSTAGGHWQLFLAGIERGFTYPIGVGLGAVTLGAGKFGGDSSVSGSSEIDISDAFISMGAFGGLLFLFIILLGFRLAFRYVQEVPHSISLPMMGLLTATVSAWIALGQYAVGPFVWFCLGAIAQNRPQAAQRNTARGDR